MGSSSAGEALACFIPGIIDKVVFFLSGAVFTAATAVAFAALTGYPAKGVRVPSAPS